MGKNCFIEGYFDAWRSFFLVIAVILSIVCIIGLYIELDENTREYIRNAAYNILRGG